MNVNSYEQTKRTASEGHGCLSQTLSLEIDDEKHVER